ncbi:glycosyltransferase family 2 protein [Terrihabitans sp. B22-R8]|uniref:glycosyltransferase family 2 protein n=1 Tax=Terrihabitans sp. B22-R8 TaxID=3425128 RepID=UPI00403C4FF2
MAPAPLFVAIPTSGRRVVLNETLLEISRQTRLPDEVLICPTTPDDVDMAFVASLPLKVSLVEAPRGSCYQRNAIIDRLCAHDDALLTFFDDDFFPMADYLQEVEGFLAAQPDVVLASGLVLADGAPGPGLSTDEARAIIAAGHRQVDEAAIRSVYNGYGCNMTVRMSVLRMHGLRFDEDLPLYGWLEDVDFSRRIASYGRVVINSRMQGIHLGVKRGRISGVRFGYSQIANPWYLFRKRTIDADRALIQVARNVGSNIRRALRPEPYVDRRGRLLGNLLGVVDLLCGRAHPKNILKYK